MLNSETSANADPDYVVRQFIASQIFQCLQDALAITRKECRKLGGTSEVLRSPARAEKLYKKETTILLLWLCSPEFHEQCDQLEINGDRYANYIFMVLSGDKESIKAYDKVAKSMASRMVVNRNGQNQSKKTASS